MSLKHPPAEEYQIFALVQSFNRRALLEVALDSFQKVLGSDARFYLYVYDAGSTDGSIDYLKTFRDGSNAPISIVTQPPKLSFSAGHNRLIQEVKKSAPREALILFYETDNAIKDREAIDQAADLIRSGEADAVGFTPLKHDGTRAAHGGAFPTKKEFLIGQRATRWLRKQKDAQKIIPQDVFVTEVAFTSPPLVSLEMIVRIGGFDEKNFPFGHSDTDLCRRINDAGGSIVVLRSTSFIHDNLEQASEWSKGRVKDYHRATFRLLEKHDGRFSLKERLLLMARHSVEIMALGGLAPFSLASRRKLVGRLELLKSCLTGYDTQR
mgnify:CR=1 FL=1